MTVNKNSEECLRRSRIAHGAGAAVGAFIVATLGLAVGIYAMSQGSQLADLEAVGSVDVFAVTSYAAFGVASAILGFVVGLFSLAGVTLAAFFSIVIGTLGLALGMLIAVGVITGPLLLIGAIVVLVRRRYYPDII
ncbi:MAG: hypothetical protein AAF788_03170 [Pseudomonadota bacterium]